VGAAKGQWGVWSDKFGWVCLEPGASEEEWASSTLNRAIEVASRMNLMFPLTGYEVKRYERREQGC